MKRRATRQEDAIASRKPENLMRRPTKQFDCSSTSCATVFFQWDRSNLRIFEPGIVPQPSDDERDLIGIAFFNPQLTINPQPLPFPDKITIIPCIGPCECLALPPQQFPAPVTVGGIHCLTIPTPAGNRTFCIPYTVPVSVAIQVGTCTR